MKVSQLFKDLAFFQVSNLFVKLFWVLMIDREIQNRLPAQEYGNYFSLNNLVLMFIVVLDLGVNVYSQRKTAQNSEILLDKSGLILFIKTILSIIFMLLVFISAYFLKIDSDSYFLLFLLVTNQILLNFIQYFRLGFNAMYRFKTDALFSILDKLIFSVVLVYLLFFQNIIKVNLLLFVGVHSIILFVVFAICFVIYKPRFKQTFSRFLKRSIVLMKLSMPFAFLFALMMVFTRLDAVMLKFLHTNGNLEADIYAMGFRLLDAASMIAIIGGTMLVSLFSNRLKDTEFHKTQISFFYHVLYFPLILLSIVPVILSQDFIEVLYPMKSNQNAAMALSLLLPNILAITLIHSFGSLLTAKNEINFLLKTAFISVVLNVIFNALLIPNYGAIGAALSSLVTQALFGFSCFFYANKDLGFKPNARIWKALLTIAMLTIIVISIQFLQFNHFLKIMTSTILAFISIFVYNFNFIRTYLKK